MVRSTTFAAVTIAAVLASASTWTATRFTAEAAPDAAESTLVPITPARILDTRDGIGVGLTGRFFSPSPRELRVTGQVDTTDGPRTVIPPGATGVLLNVTVVSPSADGFVSVRPAGTAGPPATSSLNFLAGDVAPNAVQVSIPTSGPDVGRIEITFDAYGLVGAETDILADVVAYTTTSGLDTLAAAIEAKADPPVVRRLDYDDLRLAEPVGTTPQQLRELGTVTTSGGSALRITWQSHVIGWDGGFCVFQVRVNGVNDDGGGGGSPSDVVIGAGAINPELAVSTPVSNVTMWPDLPAGEHTVSLWVSGLGQPSCADNNGSFERSVLVEELAVGG